MPYIKPERRPAFDTSIFSLVEDLKKDGFNEGDMNYIITRLVLAAFNHAPNYASANKLIGMLECVKAEFYRRSIAVYEDKKIKENGDVQ